MSTSFPDIHMSTIMFKSETISVNTILLLSVLHGGGRVNCLAIILVPTELQEVMAYICGTANWQNGIIKVAVLIKNTNSEPTISTLLTLLQKYMLLNIKKI